MSQKLKGRVALVTGASKGIGASVAKRLAAEGAAVVVNYSSSKEGAERVVAEIVKQGGRAMALKANVTHPAEVKELVAKTVGKFGKLDLLVNNAGIYEFEPLERVTADHFHKQFDLNVLALLLVTQEAVAHFASAGGAIVNISSAVSLLGVPNASVYSGTKAAVDAITRSLSKELAARKIRVNAVNPGMVETEGLHSQGIAESDFHDQIIAQTPLGRIGQPEDVASAVFFFLSDDAAWITGETLFISGGLR